MGIVEQISKFLSPLNTNPQAYNSILELVISSSLHIQEWVDEAAIRLMVEQVDMKKWSCGSVKQ